MKSPCCLSDTEIKTLTMFVFEYWQNDRDEQNSELALIEGAQRVEVDKYKTYEDHTEEFRLTVTSGKFLLQFETLEQV